MKTIRETDILVPKDCDHRKWSVVACDQFTSERAYWRKLEDFVGDAPSTLKLVFPEAYLEDDDKQQRIDTINETMRDYIQNGVFRTLEKSCVVVKRTTASGVSRLGVVCAVDLEDYCFTHPFPRAHTLDGRGGARPHSAEACHKRKRSRGASAHYASYRRRKKSVVEGLWAKRDGLEKIYDFDLNMGGRTSRRLSHRRKASDRRL